MKKIIFIIAIVAIGYFAFQSVRHPRELKAEPQKRHFTNETFVYYIMTDSRVKDAVLTNANVLYISVLDDGKKKNDLAADLCRSIKENSLSIARTKVVKFNSQNDPHRDNAYGVLLGECWCK